MIEQRIVYYCRCDNCKEKFDRYEGKLKWLIWWLRKEGWQHRGRKWFCLDCQKKEGK